MRKKLMLLGFGLALTAAGLATGVRTAEASTCWDVCSGGCCDICCTTSSGKVICTARPCQ